MRVVHYLNQFFGGIGGEEVADAEPQIRDGAIGPGRLLEQVLEDGSRVVRTVICGDNYAAENLADLTALILKETSDAGAELFVAGPCFEAGRYGVASGALCAAVSAELGIPVVTAMAVENPGVDLHRQTLYIMDSGKNASAMREVLGKMAGAPWPGSWPRAWKSALRTKPATYPGASSKTHLWRRRPRNGWWRCFTPR